jgi:hypothetical protein
MILFSQEMSLQEPEPSKAIQENDLLIRMEGNLLPKPFSVYQKQAEETVLSKRCTGVCQWQGFDLE